MNKLLIGWLIGLLVLLIACCVAFEGRLAAAIWQLSGSIWMLVWWKYTDS